MATSVPVPIAIPTSAAMALSSVSVVLNALRLGRLDLHRGG
jgi:cation transport ATPase